VGANEADRGEAYTQQQRGARKRRYRRPIIVGKWGRSSVGSRQGRGRFLHAAGFGIISDFWAVEIPNDLGLFIGLDDHGAAQEEAAGVGKDRGAASGDAAFGKKDYDPSQEVADVFGCLEIGEFVVGKLAEECGAEVVDIAGFRVLALGVPEAEPGLGAESWEFAASAGVTEEAAAVVISLGGGVLG
jgi:hypothetical protein